MSLVGTRSATYGFTARYNSDGDHCAGRQLGAVPAGAVRPAAHEFKGPVIIPGVGQWDIGPWYIPLATLSLLAPVTP